MKYLPTVAFAGAAALLGLGMVCATNAPLVPELVQVPDAVYPRAEAEFRVATTAAGDRDVVYVLDWGDGAVDTTNGWQSGDTVVLRHTWQMAGGFEVKALAFVQEEPDLASDWSEPLAVTVQANGVPVASGLEGPERTVPGAWARLRARATDSDGDSVAVQFDFAGTVGAWTAFGDTGAWFEDSFRFSTVETVTARVRARDRKGSVSGWSDSLRVPVEEAGAVLWRWVSPTGTWGTPVVALDGAEEVVYIPGDEYIYGYDGKRARVAPSPDTLGDTYFGPHSAYCVSTGHLIASTDAGEVCAYTSSLQLAWRLRPDTVPGAEWDVPAIRGNRVYIWDHYNGIWLYCIEDLGDSARVIARSGAVIEDMNCPPIVAPDGCVLYGDHGAIVKLTPDLDSVVWDRSPLSGECVALVVDDDGTVYCGSNRGELATITPDGEFGWWLDFAGAITGIVIGSDAVFIVTDEGRVCRIGKDGQEQWRKTCPDEPGFEGTPVLTRNGLLYAVDVEDGGVFCLRQEDGELAWHAWIDAGKNGSGRVRDETDLYSAAILANGNLVLSDWDGLVCIKGYEDGGLDTRAPWPKWQHDTHNSGSVGD